MKVLVTGANGLLGANVVRELLNRGHETCILARPSAGLQVLAGLETKIFIGDLLDKESLRRAAGSCDAVVHAAADTRQWPTAYRYYEPVNVTGTKRVIDTCRELGVRRIVYVSTANAFGNGTMDAPGTELSEFNGFRYNSGYMISKFVAQQWVLSEVERYRLPAVIVNPAFMIGAFDSKPSSGKIVLMGLGKRKILCPPGGKNFIHVKDAAAAVCNALTMGVPGECYLLANENLTYRGFFEKLDKVAGQRSLKIDLPAAVIRSIGLAGSLAESVSGRPAPLNYVNARLLCLGNYYSGEKAREVLQMPRTPVEDAIGDAIRWFRTVKG